METAKVLQHQHQFEQVSLVNLVLNPHNGRKFEKNFTAKREAQFEELIASVEAQGILQPLIVRCFEDGVTFEIIAGERRFRAAKRICEKHGLDTKDYLVPVMIQEADNDRAAEICLIENACREDLTAVEQAESFNDYLDTVGNKAEAVMELSAKTGIPAHVIRRSVALVALPEEAINAWREEQISIGHVEQLSRLHDRSAILEALTTCLRSRMSVKELETHLKASKPSLAFAFFDKTECTSCAHNSGQQRGLFVDTDDRKANCLNSACFELKQGTFMDAHWAKSKAKEILRTNGYRFSHHLTVSDREPIKAEVQERCLACPEFISVVTLNAKAVAGLEKCCVGKKECFDELYTPKAPVQKKAQTNSKTEPKADNTAKGKGSDKKPGKADPKADAKRAKKRGVEFREEFYKEALPNKVDTLDPKMPPAVRVMLAALAISDSCAANVLHEELGLSGSHMKEPMIEAIFKAEPEALLPLLLKMSLAPIMSASQTGYTSSPQIRHTVAACLGVNLAGEFTITEEYLKAHTKPEMVKNLEEKAVDVWGDEKVCVYREEHHKGKGLMSLKKGELIDVVLKSGVGLKGKTPQEILTAK